MILCGGSGARLWPASRPWRPKAFLNLAGDLTGLQAAALRASALAAGGEVLVVGGAQHAAEIARQLGAVDRPARLLLEPASRDTAPAIAAAAAWVQRHDPASILVVLPADHHISDIAAFRAAIIMAAGEAAAGGIVLLGVRPASPSSAYGYVLPGQPRASGCADIGAFVEKPPASQAADLVRQGALWNCGIVVASAATLLAEITRWAPAVAAAAESALSRAVEEKGGCTLGEAFASAPRAAFDHAVLERTDRGRVLPVDFPWSDLGSWDAVLAAASKDRHGNSLRGEVLAADCSGVLVRAAPGLRVAAAGVSNLAIVAEPDAVLVCDLAQAQAVRALAGEGAPRFATLAAAADGCSGWVRTAALPLWATVGVDPATGGFREALTWSGAPADPRRRARVQARQAFVFATASSDDIPGPWLRTAREGMGFFLRHGRRSDGLFAAELSLDGAQTDPTARLYEHAFLLLALSALAAAEPAERCWRDEAQGIAERLAPFRHSAGGYREAGGEPFQANAHMHLLEAFLAWEGVEASPAWRALADEIAELALSRFIDPRSGALREFFAADWSPRLDDGGLVEPGHQFEWAWLLARWGRARGDARAVPASRRLFEAGRRGFDVARGVVVNALDARLEVRDAGARLWPQTEHLKAALALGESAAALEAANGLAAYLDTPARGVWFERMRADGGFIEEPSPATSLYHLFLAFRELERAATEA